MELEANFRLSNMSSRVALAESAYTPGVAQGIDCGGYTEWERDAIKEDNRVDFAICGVAWGSRLVPTWEHNKPEIMKEARRLLYALWHHDEIPKKQGDVFLEELHTTNSHAAWVDVERSRWGLREDLSLRDQAYSIKTELDYIASKFNGRTGIYANFNDYFLISKYVDFSKYPLWIASPERPPNTDPGSREWWRKIGRNRKDYVFDQYSWEAYAPDYGAVNEKKSMDLTQFNGSIFELDVWLGLEQPMTLWEYIREQARKFRHIKMPR